jgi:hypothetical protein
MRRAILAMTLALTSCDQLPTAPTRYPTNERADMYRTSRVNPNDLSDSELEGLTLDHNPWDADVSLCRTKLREYCRADNDECFWEVDYYTLKRPEVCPLDPID